MKALLATKVFLNPKTNPVEPPPSMIMLGKEMNAVAMLTFVRIIHASLCSVFTGIAYETNHKLRLCA